MTDAEYEILFLEVLTGVNEGWTKGGVKGFLAAKDVREAELLAWLRRFGERLLAFSASDTELAAQMVQLGNLDIGEVGEVARDTGMRLLRRVEEMNPRGAQEAEKKGEEGAKATPELDKLLVMLQHNTRSVEQLAHWNTQGITQQYEERVVYSDKAPEFIDADLEAAWFNKGNRQFDVGDFAGALASYDKAIAIQPDYYQAWYGRGNVLRDLGRYEEAIASYDKAITIQPDYYQAWDNRGVTLTNLGRNEEAVASYDKAIIIQPNDYVAWGNRGSALSDLGRKEEAIASYDKAIAIQPKNYLAWESRGSALSDLGRKEEAITSWDNAIAIKPDYYLAWSNRGNALSNLGRKEEAIASHDKAITLQPDYYLAWYNRGTVLSDLGRKEDAIASWDKAIAIKPDFYLAWSNRGSALGDLGRKEEAIASYDKAIALQPNYYLAWYNRGAALSDLGQKEEAIASYDKAIALQPDYYQAWSNRGIALRDLGRYEEAIASYDKVIALQPDFYLAWSNRGSSLSDLGRNEEAIASWDNAIAIKPDLYQAWSNRGIVAVISTSCDPLLTSLSPIAKQNPALNQRGYEGALVSYEEGLKHSPQDTHPEGWGYLHYAIGNAHYFQGRSASHPHRYWRKAVNSYNQALKTLTEEDFPELHLKVLQDLIRVFLDLGYTGEAEELGRRGTDLLRRLLGDCQSPGKKKQLEWKLAGFQQLTVDIVVQLGNCCAALELAEQGKNVCLSWLLDG